MKENINYTLVVPEEMTSATIKVIEPIGYLHHEATHTNFSVYSPISIFQKTMLRICFGLRYVGRDFMQGERRRLFNASKR